MDERQAGITLYTTPQCPGFSGILKHRFQDFQVAEVGLDGSTARLTNTCAPAAPAAAGAGGPAAAGGGGAAGVLTEESIAAVAADFARIAGADNAARLADLLHSKRRQQQQQQQEAEGQAAYAPSGQQQQQQQQLQEVHLLPVADKETRKAIHGFIKTDARLPPLLTDTVTATTAAAPAAAAAAAAQDGGRDAAQQQQQPGDAGPVNIIRVRLAGSGAAAEGGGRGGGGGGRGGGRRGQKRARDDWGGGSAWPGGQSKYVRFVLLKENMETQAALQVISRMLHLRPHAFGFAGTKDKRGVTSQFVTLFKVEPARLAALNPRLRGIKVGCFDYTGSHLQLGSLQGNEFRILMRDVTPDDEQQIATSVAAVRAAGFINYFGLQRFGTGDAPTHMVGGALLRGEWAAAVALLMRGGPYENETIRHARELYLQQADAKAALAAMPTWMAAERAVLEVLAKEQQQQPAAGDSDSDSSNGEPSAAACIAGLQAVPRTLRSMYLHAWQSYVWNQAASERISRYGADAVVEGDLVLLLPSCSTAQQTQPDGAAGVAAAAAAAAAAGGGSGSSSEAAAGAQLTAASDRLAAVHRVTAADVAAGRFSMADVVLPVPGGQVQYPAHDAGWKLYCQLAAADGIVLPGETDAEYAAAVAAEAAAVAAAAAAAAAAAGGGGGAGGQQQQQADAGAAAAPELQQGAPAVTAPKQHGVREFELAQLTGDYRRLLHFPQLQHRVVRYSDPNDSTLLLSDWQLLEEREQQEHQQKRHKADADAAAPSQPPAAAAAGWGSCWSSRCRPAATPRCSSGS